MKTGFYLAYDMAAPGESRDEQVERIALATRKASRQDSIFLDEGLTAKDDKPERERMLTNLRENDTLLIHSLPNLGYPKERLELWQAIKEIGAGVKFTHKPSQRVWAVMESLSVVSDMDRQFQTAFARKNAIRKSGGRPKGFTDLTRAAIAYRVATALLPSSQYTNEDVMQMINGALPDTCKPYKTGRYWQKHVRQYAVYIGEIQHDPILGENVPLKLPKEELEKFLKLRKPIN